MPDITHVSPVLFGEDGYWGGGERFALELAREQAQSASVRLVTFGKVRRRMRLGPLSIHILPISGYVSGHVLNPVSPYLLPELTAASTIHLHQYESTLAQTVLIAGALLRKQVFVTDHGGVAPLRWPYLRGDDLVTRHLAVSRFAAQFYPELSERTTVIYGGADPKQFRLGGSSRRGVVVFVGRLLPHKGIHDLIAAIDADMPLEVYGRAYSDSYRQTLATLARGKRVTFFEAATDAQVRDAYQSAKVVVLPSVHHSVFGEDSPKCELLGLTLIEAMACGTPVVCSSAGAMPEVVEHGCSGLVYPAGNVAALKAALQRVWHDRALWKNLSSNGDKRFRERFTWERVAARAMTAYAESNSVGRVGEVPPKTIAQAAATLTGLSL